MFCAHSWVCFFLSVAATKSSRPLPETPAKDESIAFVVPPWFARPLQAEPCALAYNNVPARRGNGRTRRRLEKKTPLRPRGSETIFHSARPARFHPPGFLSGADGVYSSRQSRFAVWVQRGRTFPLHLLPIIRKNSEFVN